MELCIGNCWNTLFSKPTLKYQAADSVEFICEWNILIWFCSHHIFVNRNPIDTIEGISSTFIWPMLITIVLKMGFPPSNLVKSWCHLWHPSSDSDFLINHTWSIDRVFSLASKFLRAMCGTGSNCDRWICLLDWGLILMPLKNLHGGNFEGGNWHPNSEGRHLTGK